MAQNSIREYDAKKMLADFLQKPYDGKLIKNPQDMEDFLTNQKNNEKYIIKPDQLFGKRGKYNLIAVNLSPQEIAAWWEKHYSSRINIEKKNGALHTFLVEKFIEHEKEFYIAIKTERTDNVIYFSERGGINIEENWESIKKISIPLIAKKSEVFPLLSRLTSNSQVGKFIEKLYEFFEKYGFCYLEINPFTFDKNGEICCLDMVGKVDSSEQFLQKNHWKNVEFPHPFWEEKTESETYIDELDASTGASLKLRILNPKGRIWLLTSGGGASVVIADTLADLGFTDEIANYGECSGNPDRENTRAYAETIIKNMILSGNQKMYLIIAGAIANFTHIDKTFGGIIDAIETYKNELLTTNTTILVRRWGINDKKWLEMMREACEKMGIACEIADGNVYMTDILQKISF